MQCIRALIGLGVGASLTLACAGTTSQSPSSAAVPASSASTDKSVVRCHWIPAAADTEEPCNPQTQGSQVKVTQRDSMRDKDKKTQTATCVCD
jgi:hypothetical protein